MNKNIKSDIESTVRTKLGALEAMQELHFDTAFNQANDIATNVSVVIKNATKNKDYEKVSLFAKLAAKAYSIAAEKVKSPDRDRIRLAGSFWAMQADCANFEVMIKNASERLIENSTPRTYNNTKKSGSIQLALKQSKADQQGHRVTVVRNRSKTERGSTLVVNKIEAANTRRTVNDIGIEQVYRTKNKILAKANVKTAARDK